MEDGMSDYPDWVKKYKTKGLYVVKRANGSYSLYKGHSERVEGKNYPVLKCDEYIGTITEENGLIPYNPTIKGIVKVYEYGLWALYDKVCGILRSVANHHNMDEEVLFRRAFLKVTENEDNLGYERQWISVQDKSIASLRELTIKESEVVKRLAIQLNSKLNDTLKEDASLIINLCKSLYVVHVNGKYVLSEMPKDLDSYLEKYGITISFKEVKNGK